MLKIGVWMSPAKARTLIPFCEVVSMINRKIREGDVGIDLSYYRENDVKYGDCVFVYSSYNQSIGSYMNISDENTLTFL